MTFPNKNQTFKEEEKIYELIEEGGEIKEVLCEVVQDNKITSLTLELQEEIKKLKLENVKHKDSEIDSADAFRKLLDEKREIIYIPYQFVTRSFTTYTIIIREIDIEIVDREKE